MLHIFDCKFQCLFSGKRHGCRGCKKNLKRRIRRRRLRRRKSRVKISAAAQYSHFKCRLMVDNNPFLWKKIDLEKVRKVWIDQRGNQKP
jgi:hypothetical protein